MTNIGKTPQDCSRELSDLLENHAATVAAIEDESDRRHLDRIAAPGYPVTTAQVKWVRSLLVRGKGRAFKHWPSE